jgi:hypothetical protein
MAPPAKKRKLADEESSNSNSTTIMLVATVITDLVETLDTSSDPSESRDRLQHTSLQFLKLKALQRVLLDKVRDSQVAVLEQRERHEKQLLKLENYNYLKACCQHSMQVCKGMETPELLKLCCEELDTPLPASISAEGKDDILQKYLAADPKDPKSRTVIVAKLHQEIAERTVLDTDLKKCQLQLANLKQSLTLKRKLLHELPHKLQDMERSSLPLQKFCHRSLNPSLKMIGSHRRTCLDLAQSLPRPLYTLFYQLQSYLDFSTSSSSTGIAPSLEVINNEGASSLVLKLPIPDIIETASTTSSMSKKVATIRFDYLPEPGLVMAFSSADQGMGSLISELFPGDKGDRTLPKEEENDSTLIDSSSGKPYHWCNYIAGLHVVPDQQHKTDLHISTKVVVQALEKRVRATATLNWLLHSLSRKPHPIPVHDSMKKQLILRNSSTATTAVKLSGWAEEKGSQQQNGSIGSNGGQQYRVFCATLNNKSATLSVKVKIDVARYPAVPPKWEVVTTNSREAWGQEHGSIQDLQVNPRLYDDRLASLERRINHDVDCLVVAEDETSYDWILAQQLAEIERGWEEILNE